ncbi:MAG: hypothetical protein IIA53_05335 [Chloroflexi bacterium]|nr:hypothetical protein [Chloroflexota bacterium]
MSPSTSEIESIQPVSRLPLDGKTVVLGVTGSIAAYKAADLASKLVQAGASVDVIMTTAATEFVGVSTFEALTHRPVTTGLWQAHTELSIDHVALALRADCVLIAPATANTAPCTTGTQDMTAYPDTASAVGSADKLNDPAGDLYIDGTDPAGDKDGFLMFGHDILADNLNALSGPPAGPEVNYINFDNTTHCYTIDANGTVHQYLVNSTVEVTD